MSAQKNLLTISEAAKILGVSNDTLRRWEKAGKVAPLRTLGNSRRYKLEQLESLKNQKNSPPNISTPNTQPDSISYEEFEKQTDKIEENFKVIQNQLTQLKIQTNQSLSENSSNKNQPLKAKKIPQKSKLGFLKKIRPTKREILISVFILFFFLIVLILFLILQAISPIKNKIENTDFSSIIPESYPQINDQIDTSGQNLSNINSLIIGKDKAIFDENGNIYFSGGITGGYLDSSIQNLITNSGFELNLQGKPDYYTYAHDASSENVFISQDVSYENQNSLKFEPKKDKTLTIKPFYSQLDTHKKYTFTAYVRALSLNETIIEIGYGEEKKSVNINGYSEWNQIKFTKVFTDKDTPDISSFFISVKSNSSGGALYLDGLQLEAGGLATGYKPQLLESDGTIAISEGNIKPILKNQSTIGTKTNPFKDIFVSNSNILENLSVEKNATINGNLSVNGTIDFNSITSKNKVIIQNEGLYLGDNNTQVLDVNGSLLNIKSLTLLNDYSFDESGNINANNATFNNDLQVNNDASISGKLRVNKKTNLTLGLEVDQDADFNDNVTIDDNLTISGSFSLGGNSANEISEDTSLTDNSNAKLVTQKAVKTYIDNLFYSTNSSFVNLQDVDFSSYSTSRVLFETSNSVTDSAHFTWNNTENFLSIPTIKSSNTSYLSLLSYSGNGLYILDNGNIGIGTNSPSDKLEINGGITATTGSFTTLNTGNGAYELQDATTVLKGLASFNDSYFSISSGAVSIDDIYLLNSGDTATGNYSITGAGSFSSSLTTSDDLYINGGEIYLNPLSSSSSTTEGTIYYNTNDDNLYLYSSSGWVDLTVQGGGANTYLSSALFDTSTGNLGFTLSDSSNFATSLDGRYLTQTSFESSTFDLSTTNELQNLWFAFSADTGVTSANSQTDSLTIAGGGILTSAIVGDTLTLTATEVDGSVTNELQNLFAHLEAQTGSLSASSQDYTLSIAGISTTNSVLSSGLDSSTLSFTLDTDLSQYDNTTSGFITDGNSGWDNSYNFITLSDLSADSPLEYNSASGLFSLSTSSNFTTTGNWGFGGISAGSGSFSSSLTVTGDLSAAAGTFTTLNTGNGAYELQDATVSDKGLASFSDSYFSVSSGAVSIDDIYLLNTGDSATGNYSITGSGSFSSSLAVAGNLSADFASFTSSLSVTDKISAASANGLALYDDGGNGIFIEDGGNVGIGTTDPQEALDVSGISLFNGDSNSTEGDIYIGGGGWPYSIGTGWEGQDSTLRFNAVGTAGGTSAFRNLRIYNGKESEIATFEGSTKRMSTGGVDTTPDAMLEVIQDSSSPLLMLSSAAANNGDLLIVDSSGNVGIGSTTPNHKLDVTGNLGLSASAYFNFSTVNGESGYGIRDNSGTLQYKSSGGSWANISNSNTYLSSALFDTSTGNLGFTLSDSSNFAASLDGRYLTQTSFESTTFDLSTTNELQNLWFSFTADSGNTSASSQTDALTIAGSGILTSAIVGDTLTLTATEVDGSTTNELQNLFAHLEADTGSLSASSQDYTLSIAGFSTTNSVLSSRLESSTLSFTLDTDLSQFDNTTSAFITDGNTNWDNSYNFITLSDLSADSPLEYNSASGLFSLSTSSNFTTTGDWGFNSGTFASSIQAASANGLALYDDGGNGIFIEDGGFIGIGTTNPVVGLSIGSASPNHGGMSESDDLFVSGSLEVDGNAYIDGTLYPQGDLKLATSASIYFANSANIAGISGYFVDTNINALQLHGGSSSNDIVITSVANKGKNHDHSSNSNPSLFVHSSTDPDSDNTQWLSLTHNITNGVISTGTGGLILTPFSGNVGIGTTDPNNALEVVGSGSFSSSLSVTGDLSAAAGTFTTLNTGNGAYEIQDATTALKGLASFSDSYFSVSSGAVSIDDIYLLNTGDSATGNYSITGSGSFSSSLAVAGNLSADFASFTSSLSVTDKISAASANGLALYDDGGNGIFIEDGGNVGIGTTDPNASLDVVASTATFRVANGSYPTDRLNVVSSGNVHVGLYPDYNLAKFHILNGDVSGGTVSSTTMLIEEGSPSMQLYSSNSGTSSLYLGQSVSGLKYNESTDNLTLFNSNTDNLTIASSGFTSFSNSLSVTGSISATDANGLFLSDDSSNGIFIEDGGNIGIGTNNPTGFLTLDIGTANKDGLRINSYDNETSNYPIYLSDENANTDFFIKTDGAGGTTSTAYFRGNVGIGTTNPSNALEVVGSGSFSSSLTITSNLSATSASFSSSLVVSDDLHLSGALYDTNASVGTSGQVLSTTESGVDWIDASGVGTDDQTLAEVLGEGYTTSGSNMVLSTTDELRFYDDDTDTRLYAASDGNLTLDATSFTLNTPTTLSANLSGASASFSSSLSVTGDLALSAGLTGTTASFSSTLTASSLDTGNGAYELQDATISDKGLASFSDSYFSVSSGAVSIDDIYLLNSGDTATGNYAITGSVSFSSSLAISDNFTVAGHSAFGNNATIDQDIFMSDSTASTVINIEESITSSPVSGYNQALRSAIQINPSSNLSNSYKFTANHSDIEIPSGNDKNVEGNIYGTLSEIYHLGTGTLSSVYGLRAGINNNASGDITNARGVYGSVWNQGGDMETATGVSGSIFQNVSGTIDEAYGGTFNLSILSGTITDGYGIKISSPGFYGGTFTNNYGLYIDDQSGAGSSASFNLYSAGSSTKNYFEGLVGIGTTDPSYTLEVSGDGYFSSSLNIGGSLVAGSGTFSSSLNITGDILPGADDTYNLGSDSLRFANLYLGGETIHIGTGASDEGEIGYNTTTNVLSLQSDGNLALQPSSGNVGIGTTDPSYKLEVSGAGSFSSSLSVTGSISATDASGLALYDDGNNGIFIEDGGQIGIGTTNPGVTLDVNGIIRANDNYISAWETSTGNNHRILMNVDTANSMTEINATYGATAWPMSFQIAGNEKMRVHSDGNIGIGTTNPSFKLQVAGAGRFDSSLDVIGGMTIGSANDEIVDLTIGSSAAGYNGGSVTFKGATGVDIAQVKGYYKDATHKGSLEFYSYDSSLQANMLLTGQGNLGIGATVPQHKLDVLGDTAGDYIVRFRNIGNDETNYGIEVWGGADDGSGTTYYFTAVDGNGNSVGALRNVSGTFALTDLSDERLKMNIEDTNLDGLDIINSLNVKDYNWRQNPDGPIQHGLIAQEVMDVFPYMVIPGDDGYYSLAYEFLIPVLTKGMQQQQQIIDSLDLATTDSISSFNSQLTNLESDIAYLILSSTGDIILEDETYSGLLAEATPAVLSSLSYTVKDNLGNTVDSIAAFGEIMVGGLKASFIEAKNFVADTASIRRLRVSDELVLDGVNVANELDSLKDQINNVGIGSQIATQSAQLEVNNLSTDIISPIIENEPILLDSDASISGELTAQSGSFADLLINNEASISGSLTIGDNSTISAEPVLNVLGDATISGSLRVNSLEAENIKANSIEGLDAKLGQIVTSSLSAQAIELNKAEDNLRQEIENLISQNEEDNNWQETLDQLSIDLNLLKEASQVASLNISTDLSVDSQLNTASIDAEIGTFNSFLAVTGVASIVNLEVTNNFSIGETMEIDNNSLTVADGIEDTLYLQKTGIGKVDILAGAVTINTSGDMTVNGDLYLAGNLYADKGIFNNLEVNTATVSGQLFADLIKSDDDINLVLGDSTASQSAQFNISNEDNEVVASIDASGSATLKKVVIAEAKEASNSGVIGSPTSPTVASNATAGTASIESGETEITIQNNNVTDESLVYITPTSDTGNNVIYIKNKIGVSENLPGSFTVTITNSVTEDVEFNWWIIN